MNETYPTVAEYIENGRRSDRYVTGNKAEELIKSFNEMDLDLSPRSNLRPRKKLF
jgi:hypothetical protein